MNEIQQMQQQIPGPAPAPALVAEVPQVVPQLAQKNIVEPDVEGEETVEMPEGEEEEEEEGAGMQDVRGEQKEEQKKVRKKRRPRGDYPVVTVRDKSDYVITPMIPWPKEVEVKPRTFVGYYTPAKKEAYYKAKEPLKPTILLSKSDGGGYHIMIIPNKRQKNKV